MGLVDWKGRENPLVDAVKAISIIGEEDELDRMRGGRVADRVEDDPRFRDGMFEPNGPAPQAHDPNELVRYGPEPDDVIPRWVIEGDVAGASGKNQSGTFENLMAGWAGGGSQGQRALDANTVQKG